MEAALEEEMKVLLQHETEKLRKKLSGAHADDPLSIRRDLAGKDPVQILLSVFDACNKHFRGPQQAKVGTFMQMITEKPALRRLFLLAIYEGAYGADTLLPKFMEDHFPVQASGAPQQDVHVFLQPQGVCKIYYMYGDFVMFTLISCLDAASPPFPKPTLPNLIPTLSPMCSFSNGYTILQV